MFFCFLLFLLLSFPLCSAELWVKGGKRTLSRIRTHYRPFCDRVSRRRGNPAVVRIQPEYPKARTNTCRHCHPPLLFLPPRRRDSDLSGGAVAEATRPLGRLLLGDGNDVDGDTLELRGLHHVSRGVRCTRVSSPRSSTGKARKHKRETGYDKRFDVRRGASADPGSRHRCPAGRSRSSG